MTAKKRSETSTPTSTGPTAGDEQPTPVDAVAEAPTETLDPVEDTAPIETLDDTTPLEVVDATAPLETVAPEAETSPLDVFATTPAPSAPVVDSPVIDSPVVDTPAVETATWVAQPARRRLRVGTVVWGLVIAAFGLGVVAWASGARIDLQLAMIVLLAVAGTALLVGSILSATRNAHR